MWYPRSRVVVVNLLRPAGLLMLTRTFSARLIAASVGLVCLGVTRLVPYRLPPGIGHAYWHLTATVSVPPVLPRVLLKALLLEPWRYECCFKPLSKEVCNTLRDPSTIVRHDIHCRCRLRYHTDSER